MPDWLELELAEELRPAAAPDELWERIRGAAPVGQARPPANISQHRGARAALRPWSPSWASWPIAAIVTLMIAAATLWLVAKGQEPALDLQQLAIQELRDPAPLDLRCTDPTQINDWMRRQAGVSLSVPQHTGAHLAGARMIRKGGLRIGALTYRVGDETAILLVARAAPAADFGHGHAQWQAQGQVYGLASSNPDRPEAACLLCHASL
jgi:hypothetical protein